MSNNLTVTAQRLGNRIVLGQSNPETSEDNGSSCAEPGLQTLSDPFPGGRTLRWIPRDTPDAKFSEEPRLVITQDVLVAIDRYTRCSPEFEVGGFLLGNRYRCPNTGIAYVLIDQYWEARFAISEATSLRLTPDTWADLDDQLQTKFRGKLLIGWYHSHPGMAVFLSEEDLALHSSRFAEPWMFAIVVEPLTRTGGIFGMQNGQVNPTRILPFYEYFCHRSSGPVVDWNNYAPGLTAVKNEQDSITTSPLEVTAIANLPIDGRERVSAHYLSPLNSSRSGKIGRMWIIRTIATVLTFSTLLTFSARELVERIYPGTRIEVNPPPAWKTSLPSGYQSWSKDGQSITTERPAQMPARKKAKPGGRRGRSSGTRAQH